MEYRKIDHVELFRDRFRIDATTARQIEALLDEVIAPTTFSVVRETAADMSDVEQLLVAFNYLIGGGGVQKIVRGDELVGLWTGRDGEKGWAMIRSLPENSWEIASPKAFAERFHAELSPQ